AHVADDDGRRHGDEAGRDHLAQRGARGDVDAAGAVRPAGALHEAGDLAELAPDLGDHAGGRAAHGRHGEGGDEEGQHAADEHPDDDLGVDDVEADLVQADRARVRAEEGEGGERGGADREALADRRGRVADGVQPIGDAAHLGAEAAHLRDATCVVRDRAVRVHRHGDADRREHADRRDADAVQAGEVVRDPDRERDQQDRCGRRFHADREAGDDVGRGAGLAGIRDAPHGPGRRVVLRDQADQDADRGAHDDGPERPRRRVAPRRGRVEDLEAEPAHHEVHDNHEQAGRDERHVAEGGGGVEPLEHLHERDAEQRGDEPDHDGDDGQRHRLEPAPLAKPLTTSEKNPKAATPMPVAPRNKYRIPTPSNPSAATDSPITAPPKNATRSAMPCPASLAAADVRTFARVAAVIPKNPARIELIAPVMNAPATSPPTANQRSPATITRNTARTEYSRRRNAIAPSWIRLASSCIVSLPAGWLLTYRYSTRAPTSPSNPSRGDHSAQLASSVTDTSMGVKYRSS